MDTIKYETLKIMAQILISGIKGEKISPKKEEQKQLICNDKKLVN